MTDAVEKKLEGPVIFGRKLGEIPCFRDSYLYGICSGIGSGLAYFMFSSKPRISTHVGFSAFIVTTLGFWTYCRYNWEKEAHNATLLKEYMKDYIIKEGTKQEKKLEPEIVQVSNV